MQYPVIRQLIDSDRWRLRPHFKALDATDRRLRFGVVLNDSAIDRYVDMIDFDTEAVLSIADSQGNLIAVAHVAPAGEGAELGLSVHQAARGAGLGGILFAQAVAWARNRYLQRVFMHCLRENQAILHLARRNGMSISMDGSDSQAVLMLQAPTFETLINEQATHWQAAADDMRRLENRWFDWVLTGPQAAAKVFSESLQGRASGAG